ncbi:MAG: hypothetical protein AB1593_03865 [Pseudomonadota bacterium]
MTVWMPIRRALAGWGRTLCAGLAALAAMSPAWAGWSMNDATVVYPLPQTEAELNAMLAPQDAGKEGPLLPQKFWQRLPAINQGESPALTYRSLRVVAVRFDPCFRDGGACHPQVRFVWQPIGLAVYGSTSIGGLEAKDAAVHTFHTLSPAIFREMMAEYDLLSRRVADLRDDQPLQVHPAIRKQGLDGRFAQGLKRLLLKYCGESSLWRVTAMSTLVGADKWEFHGFNIVDGKPVDIVIPRTGNATRQSYFVSLLSERDYTNGKLSPAPTGEDNLNRMLRDSRTLVIRGTDTLRSLAESVVRIENPDIHSAESMDCVSCHTSQVAGTLLFDKQPRLAQDPEIIRQAYRSSPLLRDLPGNPSRPRVLRALGYFEKFPVLSRRAVNETAEVVERLNRSVPRWGQGVGKVAAQSSGNMENAKQN